MNMNKPIILYGSNISYFTGKMENYFKVKEIPYSFKAMRFPSFKKTMIEKVGVQQMPAVVLNDGRWMTDTTKMIQWFESNYPQNTIIPNDASQAFLCFLIEDWADEWWWRPAMHYRWFYEEGARFASWHLADEILGDMPLPKWFKRRYIQNRQRNGYTSGDGIDNLNFRYVEQDFLNLLKILEDIFSSRKFLFGSKPSLGDIGLSGPFFRHFALDPVPLEIIKQKAPNVLSWVSNLWKYRMSSDDGKWLDYIPQDIEPLIQEIGKTYLPYLNENVSAVRENKKTFNFINDQVSFKNVRYSLYRVWCLKELRGHFQEASKDSQSILKDLLQRNGSWTPLWEQEDLPIDKHFESNLPFTADSKMIGVYEK